MRDAAVVPVVPAMAITAIMAVGGLTACTSSTSDLTASSTRPPASTPVVPTPSMTALDTVRCAVTRELPPGRDLLPALAIWPAGGSKPSVQSFQTVAGTGVGATGCRGALPASGCRPLPPWNASPSDDFFVASGATRRFEGAATTSFAGTGETGSGVTNLQSVRYGLVQLRDGDPRGALAYLRRAMRQCASAVPLGLGGHPRLVGTGPSEFRQGPANVVLLEGSDAAAWLVVDGTTQVTEGELARIVTVAASRLPLTKR